MLTLELYSTIYDHPTILIFEGPLSSSYTVFYVCFFYEGCWADGVHRQCQYCGPGSDGALDFLAGAARV